MTFTSPRPAARTLLLALDAVPYRVVKEACALGAFASWPGPSAVIAPFPSLTHPAFAALFEPFGVAPSWGYEVRYFDAERNRTVGGNPLTYRSTVPPWREFFDAPHRGIIAKTVNYVSSLRAAASELDAVFDAVLESQHETVIAYLGATDGLMHLYADGSLREFLFDLDRRVGELRSRHEARRRRPLNVALFSDHGCGRSPVHYTGSLKPLLRDAGFRVVGRLEEPDDVVAPTFGIVNYGALFLQTPGRARDAAHAMTAHEGVEIAAFSPSPSRVEVISRSGSARISWRGASGNRRFSYESDGDDVLHLGQARRRLEAAGLLGADRQAHEDDWLHETAFGVYPDPLRRLADALTGERITNRASVLLSLGPGWSWGLRSVFAGGLVRGGRLKGTHGGLDRDSSLGFLLASDPALGLPGVLRAGEALAPFASSVGIDHGVTARSARTGSPGS